MASRLPLVPLLALALCACGASPARKGPAPAPRKLTPKDRTQLEQTYYRAVSAYSEGDYEACDLEVERILAVDPEDNNALALRRRLRAAKKAARP